MDLVWYHYVLGVIAFVIILGIIVLIHEGGHFLLARKAGILCHEFSIGMGPVLFQKKIGETVYSIRAIPIGGFVSMAGEEVSFDALKDVKKVKLEFDELNRIKSIIADIDNAKYDGMKVYKIVSYDIIGTKEEVEGELFMEVESEENVERFEVLRNAMMYFPKKQTAQIAPYNRNFANKSLLQRFLSVFAGPAMNFVLALAIFFVLGFTRGYVQENKTELNEVDKTAPIYLATKDSTSGAIDKNDEIISIEGIKVFKWNDITNIMKDFALNGKSGDIEYDGALTVVYTDSSTGKKETVEAVVPNTIFYPLEIIFKSVVDAESEKFNKPYIDGINEKKAKSGKAGLKNGDLITGIAVAGGKNDDTSKLTYDAINSISDLVNYEYAEGKSIKAVEGKVFFALSYTRDGEVNEDGTPKTLYSKPIEAYTKAYLEAADVPAVKLELGISPVYKFDIAKIFYKPFVETGECVVKIFKSLGLLFNPKANVGIGDFSSVIGIYELITNATAQGFNTVLYIFAFLSANIGFVNLLPLPALDGGRLAFLLFEAITRKKPSPKVENIIHTIGLFALMGLMGFIIINEILRMIGIL